MQFKERAITDNIISIKNIDTPIYRIFSLSRIKEWLRSNELVLVNPGKWDDPFENFFLKSKIDIGGGEIASLDALANDWYGQCWTTNEDTDAMWRIYSHNKDGIRVKTTVRKLFTSIYDEKDTFASLKYFIGKVDYKTQDEIINIIHETPFSSVIFGGQNNKFASLLCIKREAFSHEQEIRILINDVDQKKGDAGCYRVHLDPRNVLDEICIDPRANNAQLKIITSEIKALNVNLPIIQSNLYKISLPDLKL
ncbi:MULTISPECIES: DUF2971 domain-containing protein [Aeromonas]|uniref:DUF2971 domain-containing protein n=1 Tax=Aeromonas TaxID=642 RepID=UPI001F4512EE|nr:MULTISPECIES: DUF2971 domain-containing protein [Aeromonas]MCF5904933.1 DUF2971 domain-containing protein [Aeromonas veronii]